MLSCRLFGSLFAGVLALGVVQQIMADNDTLNVLNIQPAMAISVGDWNLITRTIAPLVYVPNSSGGGLGKIFKISSQPANASVQSCYNAATRNFGPDWSLRLQPQFLLPK